jgi:hypothetical protein
MAQSSSCASAYGFGDFDGKPLGIHSGEIEAALTRRRDLIRRLAQANYRDGGAEVTLDAGDFPVQS